MTGTYRNGPVNGKHRDGDFGGIVHVPVLGEWRPVPFSDTGRMCDNRDCPDTFRHRLRMAVYRADRDGDAWFIGWQDEQ